MQEPKYPFPYGGVPRTPWADQDIFNTPLKPMEEPELPKAPELVQTPAVANALAGFVANMPMSAKYPKYYKDVSKLQEIDVYGVHQLFGIDDPSGAIQHASKKLLLSGVRTGGKTKYHDIQEARDTLNRWLELNKE